MKISIIIVSWNVKKMLDECLDSIYQNSFDVELEVYVVDNASSDGSVDLVKEKFPQVNLIINEKNLGFAKANNQALKLATGDFLLLLNPDTVIFPETLVNSISFMAEHQDCGIMGSKMVFADKRLQPSVRRFPTLTAIAAMLLKLPKILPMISVVQKYLATDFNYNQAQIVDQVMGAYMFIRKEAFEKIGLLDERFFIWFEEVDYCFRCYQNNFNVWYNPEVLIIHHGGQSFSQQQTVTKQARFFKSSFIYFMKNKFKLLK